MKIFLLKVLENKNNISKIQISKKKFQKNTVTKKLKQKSTLTQDHAFAFLFLAPWQEILHDQQKYPAC